MTDSATIFIIDDDSAIRESLTMLLEAAGYSVKTFSSAQDYLDAYSASCDGCILMDVKMPGMDGMTLQSELQRRGIDVPIIFLTAYGTIPTAVNAIKSGALDFLTKPVDGAHLRQRIQQALRQYEEARKNTKQRQVAMSAIKSLTGREQEIMNEAVEGRSNKEIARKLGISPRTVEVHRTHIFQKTGAENLLELARMAALCHST